MKTKAVKDKRVVLVTCGSKEEAQRIAAAVVGGRLAACVNLLGAPVESTYWWKGKLETSSEFLLVIKTGARLLPELQEEISRLHGYDVPEFIALPIVAGSEPYLRWLGESVRHFAAQSAKPQRRRKN